MNKLIKILIPSTLLFQLEISAQITYTIQTGNFTTNGLTVNTNSRYVAGSFNNSAKEVGFYANDNGNSCCSYNGDPGVASFQTFTTNGVGSGTARPLKVGDQFSIICYVGNSSSFFNNSSAGISFNDNTTYSNFSNFNTAQRARFQINTNGNWFPAGVSAGQGYATPGQDVTFTIKVTSANTINLTISGTNGATTYDMKMANSPSTSGDNISSYAIWNQSSGSSNDMYWKEGLLTSTGSVEIGNGNGTSTFDGVISNGLEANSTSTSKTNTLTKAGTGTITLTAQNTYTGLTTVSAGTLILNRTGGTTIPNTNDVTINGGTLRISTDQEVDDLILSSGKLIVDNGATLIINGSYTGGGTIENNGTIVNKSSSAFPGNSTTISAMKNLEVNNASGLTLNRSLTINGDLKLTLGALILDTCNLILGPSATISGTPSSSNMIVTNGTGTVRKEWGATGSFTFPIGDNTGTAEYSPITLDFTQGTFGTGAYAEVNVTNAKHGSNSSTTDFINRYWTVNQSGISSFSCDVDLVYVDADLNGTEANIYCGKYDGSSWSQGNQADANTNTLSFTGASSFSTFTGGEAAVLPISLLDFKAERINADHAVVHWSTASEVNNSHFELMRSRDGSNFEHLCQIDGAGNSHELINYRWLDEQAGSQAIYYQIKQTDFNGETEIFGPIRLAALADVPNELKFYPNPVSDVCHLELIEAEPDLLAVQLMDVQGRILYQKDWQLGRGHHLLEIPMAELQGGTYVLRIGNGFSWTYKRLMKN